ncbi:MAG TPA: YrzE family protein [Acidimicrobiia bacterium]|nr:YrzE family protein [Acidimicrobiia bacterium]
MATTAVEQSKTRSDLAQLAGTGPVSPMSILAGVLVGYATFAILLSGAIAVLHHRGSKLDLTESWDKIGTRGGVLIGLLLFVSYLWAGYVAGRMGWRRGVLHGLGVFVGSILVAGAVGLAVRSLAKPKDIKTVSEMLRSFGVPSTREEWRHVGSFAGVASLAGMLLGSVLGGFLGEHWFTKLTRRAQRAEIDVRERLAATNGTRSSNGNGHKARAKSDDLDELSREELYQRAQEEDIAGRSQMNKEELKQALQNQN